jgi:hypothetical protein
MAFSYDVRANTIKNRLYVRMVGSMSDAEAKQVATTIMEEIKKLKAGFTVINDISQLKPAGEQATEHLKAAQQASARHGCSRVVRVVGAQSITHMQWNRTLQNSMGVRADQAASVEEAERLLEEK